MKMPDEQIPVTEEGFELRYRERPGTQVRIELPLDVIASLEQIARTRDMSVEALLKFYIGQNLRQDLAKLFADHVLEKTEQVLTRHLHSDTEVSTILEEIRVQVTT